ncbi:MAG: GerMN domain-containing protein [Capsulimonadales bacterium]|nr:GerMN domain-containing protein [Capsulimonadales bacterium]
MKPTFLGNRKHTLAGVSVAAVLLFQMVLSACQQQVASRPQDVPVAETRPQILPSPMAVASPSPGGEKGMVAYRVVSGEEGAHLEPINLPAGTDRESMTEALNAMATIPDSPLPKGTRALSVTYRGDLATVDFNRAFSKNFEGGDEKEALMFNAITATVGQVPGVKRVQILVDGRKVPVGGTQDTTEPLDVPPSVTQVSQRRGEAGESGSR